MREKKMAINISLIMIMVSFAISLVCFFERDVQLFEIGFAFATGVFGSSFATLWIFIYEYNNAKKELLNSIFNEFVSILKKMETLPLMERYGLYEMQDCMSGEYYVMPVFAEHAEEMNREERCLYEMSRFVDVILDIGYENICGVLCKIDGLDFWTDSFKRNRKIKAAVQKEISFPVYDVLISAPAEENGSVFQYFAGFKYKYSYSAEEIYSLVKKLDTDINGTLHGHLYEKLWIFRDALFSSSLSRSQRRKARRALVCGDPYDQIR